MLLIKSKNWLQHKIKENENEITDHDYSNKYTTTPEFKKLTREVFAASLIQANLASKTNIANFVKKEKVLHQMKKN